MKSNEEILADQRAFMDAYRRAREVFMTIDGVVGVGYGQKETGGRYRDDIAIIVYVREKKPEDAVPPDERIPVEFDGYRTDVRVVRHRTAQACVEITTSFDKIQGGIQVMPKMTSAGETHSGTLACIVRKRHDTARDNVYLLSNKHVLFAGGSTIGDVIYHPFAPPAEGFQAPGPSRALGPVQKMSFYENVQATVPDPTNPNGQIADEFFLDCAIARIDIDSTCCGSTCTKDTTKISETTITELNVAAGNDITDVRSVFGDLGFVGKKVFKVGRSTRRTAGIVRGVGAPIIVSDYVNTSVQFQAKNTIDIEFDKASDPTQKNCAGHGYFSEKGDSGALVVDEQGRAVGLLSQGPNPGDPDGETSNACHIVPILDKLQICIPTTTGTSHGSTKATDGSGLQPSRSDADPALFPAGQIVFTADTAEPVTDTEQQHMLELLERFRATRRGRELHDIFGLYRREIGYLIRNHKLVKVAWQRYKGPAFLVHVLHHLKGHSDSIPREVAGVSVATLIMKMGELLMAYGSNPLREVIRLHWDEGMRLLSRDDLSSVNDCIAYLQQQEAA